MNKNLVYKCTICDSVMTILDDGLSCENGHFVESLPTKIESLQVPNFASFEENANEYSVCNAAEFHDNALNWLFATFGGDEKSLRSQLVQKLRLEAGQKVLITGAGAGNDLPFIASEIGLNGEIVALDYAKQMLLSAAERSQHYYGLEQFNIEFCLADATDLPFFDDYFDCAYHFGGINLFSSIAKGFSEMDRVVKPGGKVLVCDEGLAPWLKQSELGKMLINNNPLYAYDVPLVHIPATARDVNVSWVVSNCFYVIDYVVGDGLPDVDIDVVHLGTRGGSIRKRYFGQLEGVDIQLKDLVYKKAMELGVSRVDLLEKLLKSGLKDL